MYLLGWDTSTLSAVLALFKFNADGTFHLISSKSINAEARHSENLLYQVDQLLTQSSLTLGELSGLCIGVGPGSFTGLRIGIATARGLMMGSPHLQVISFSSLLALRKSSPTPQIHTSEVTLSLSTKSELYFRYEEAGAEPTEGSGPYHEVFNRFLSSITPPISVFQHRLVQWPTGPSHPDNPPIAEIVELSPLGIAALSCQILKNKGFSRAQTLVPNYARLSEPERRRLGLVTR